MGKIIPFVKSTTERPKIIDFQEAVRKINQRSLDELTSTESLLETTPEGRCGFYHPNTRGFQRELREGNPDVACCVCDGYNEDCPAYHSAR